MKPRSYGDLCFVNDEKSLGIILGTVRFCIWTNLHDTYIIQPGHLAVTLEFVNLLVIRSLCIAQKVLRFYNMVVPSAASNRIL